MMKFSLPISSSFRAALLVSTTLACSSNRSLDLLETVGYRTHSLDDVTGCFALKLKLTKADFHTHSQVEDFNFSDDDDEGHDLDELPEEWNIANSQKQKVTSKPLSPTPTDVIESDSPYSTDGEGGEDSSIDQGDEIPLNEWPIEYEKDMRALAQQRDMAGISTS